MYTLVRSEGMEGPENWSPKFLGAWEVWGVRCCGKNSRWFLKTFLQFGWLAGLSLVCLWISAGAVGNIG